MPAGRRRLNRSCDPCAFFGFQKRSVFRRTVPHRFPLTGMAPTSTNRPANDVWRSRLRRSEGTQRRLSPAMQNKPSAVRARLLAHFRFSRFSRRLRCGSLSCARLLLRFHGPFSRGRCGFWFFLRGCLPLSRFFAFLAPLLLVQIPSKLLIGKTAAEAGS